MTSAALPYEVIDAFTTRAGSGNPAAVVRFSTPSDPRSASSSFMLSVAADFGFSETAFLVPLPSVGGVVTYALRWFTPIIEFPLCGHATLASSHVLFSTYHPTAPSLRFETMSGPLSAHRTPTGSIELDFPGDASVLGDEEDPEEVQDLLARAIVAHEGWELVGYAKGGLGWVVEVGESCRLEGLDIDFLKGFTGFKGGMVMFTQPALKDSPFDIESRVFDPVEEIPEDPVTGSAHCMLAPYWLATPFARSRLPSILKSPLPDTLLAKQVSERGGDLEVSWDRSEGRIKLRGKAVSIKQGVIDRTS